MKILYLDQTGQLGGGEIAILPWLQHTASDATMILLEDGPFRPLLEQAGVPVEIMTLAGVKAVRRESGLASIAATLPAFFNLRKGLQARLKQADVLYANSQKAFLLAALSKRRGQPLVWHLRDILTAAHFSPILRRIAVAVSNRYATAIIANSQATADALIAAGGKPEKVTVVYDGVSAAPFVRAAAGSAAFSAQLRQELGVEPGTTLVGVFGRLSNWKGQHVLLEAIQPLSGVHAVLVGDALFGESAYAEGLKTLTEKTGIADRVHFLGFRSDIPDLMCAMDIIVHTSTSPEPFGLVIVEGMLAQRPVIATAGGGALEVLIDGKSGLLTEPGSAEALRAAITSLLQAPDWAQELAANGRQRAEAHFSPEALFAGIERVLSELPVGSAR